jgi:hypothetical protein
MSYMRVLQEKTDSQHTDLAWGTVKHFLDSHKLLHRSHIDAGNTTDALSYIANDIMEMHDTIFLIGMLWAGFY